MTQQEQQQFDELKSQVEELLRWKQEQEGSQLKIPLDINTRNIINTHLPVFKRYDTSTATADGKITVEIDGIDYYINVDRV